LQSLTLPLKGLFLNSSELLAPEGSLSVATNIVIDRDNVATPRRGFDRLAAGFSDTSYRANKLFVYQNKLLAHYSSNLLAYYNSGAWTALSGTYTPPANADTDSAYTTIKTRSAQSNKNFYYTTAAGVYKLAAYNGTPVLAGAYKGLDIQASASSSATWLEGGNYTAYRVVWGYKDANNNVILGAVSQREVYQNTTGGDGAVSLRITIPTGITTAWFVQLYRAAQGSSEPNDEMGLVYETNPTSGNISDKYIDIDDITDDDLRGATLYTSASQEGLAASNEQPPLAKDIAVYKDHMFYANVTSKHRYFLTLLGVGGTNGIAVDDTLTIDGVTYTAKAAENTSSGQFRAYTPLTFTFVDADVNTGTDTITENGHSLQNGDAVRLSNSGGALPGGLALATTYYVVGRTTNTFQLAAAAGGSAIDITSAAGGGTHTLTYQGSAAQNIRDTAISLVRTINRYVSSTVYAYYLSGPDDLPGKILLEARSLGTSSFAVTSSEDSCWSPVLPSSGTTESSTNDAYKNGIFFSKPGQPEAVPLPQIFFAGSQDHEILRIIPLRDSLFILKQDGIYRLSGESANSFRVDLFDSTTKLIAPESAVVLNNQVWALTDQGVVSITEGGVQVRSRAIESALLALQGASLDKLRNLTFGVSYETDRKYILWTIDEAGDTAPTTAYVFNLFTNAWTQWDRPQTCGLVSPTDDKLYLGDADSHYVNQERKTFNYTDHVDYGFAATISAVNGTTLTISDADRIAAGDVIYASSTVFSTVASVDTVAGTVTVDYDASFSAGSVSILKAISTAVAWVPSTLGNPGARKQIREVGLLFKSDFTGTGSVLFSSDETPAQETETITGTSLGLWGLFAFGAVPWGGENGRRPFRVMVPRNMQRCTQLTVEFRHSVGYASYQLNGLSAIGEMGSERFRRA
jgi:hypothetical protein